MTLSPGIDGPILSALQQVFALELQQHLVGDPLALKTLKQADLQDDPTITAPYLVFRDDIKKGHIRMPKDLEYMYGSAEIGGPARYLHYFEAKFGTPVATTREEARSSIDTLDARIQLVLQTYLDLSGVLAPGQLTSPDLSRRIEGANELLVDDAQTRIYGGEQTFYGEGHIYWHYPVSSYTLVRVYTGH